jgi:hypothetical protein
MNLQCKFNIEYEYISLSPFYVCNYVIILHAVRKRREKSDILPTDFFLIDYMCDGHKYCDLSVTYLDMMASFRF